MSETIILECNRQVAYSQEKNALKAGGVISENNTKFQKHKWKTHIPDGLAINAGDQIQVEAAMLNSIGGGDEVMEFTGEIIADKMSDNKRLDNSADLECSYYVNDLNQFNIKYPKKQHTIIEADMGVITPMERDFRYGGPNLTTYFSFLQCYYNSKLEGGVYNNADHKKLWEQIADQETATQSNYASIQNPAFDMNFITNKRLFVGSKDFKGVFYAGRQTGYNEENALYQKFTKMINFKAPVGFISPGALGESLTAQFHQRDGNADKFDPTTIQGREFKLEAPGNIRTTLTTTITDQSFLSFPTTTGDMLYGRLDGTFPVKLNGEQGAAAEGTGYTEENGTKLWNKHLLSANPDRYTACSIFSTLRQKHAGDTNFLGGGLEKEASVYTGLHLENIPGTGNVGNFGCQVVFWDQVDTYDVNTQYQKKASNFKGFNAVGTLETINSMKLWDGRLGTLLPTNIPYNEDTLGIIKRAFANIERCANTTGELDFQNDEFKQALKVDLNIGETDDMNSCSSIGEHIFLQAPLNKWTDENAGTFYNSYPEQVPERLTAKNPANQNIGNRLASIAGNGKAYQFPVFSRLLGSFDLANYPSQNIADTPFRVAAGSIWQPSFGTDMSPSKNLDLAVIPVVMDPGQAQNYKIGNTPFCAFVLGENLTDSQNVIPAPMIGEFFGISRSVMDNNIGKLVNLQKTTILKGTDNKNYYQTANTIYDYMPFCYVGASDPSIEFDGDNTKFAIKQLHTSLKSGNGVFPEWQEGYAPQENHDPTQDILAINTKIAACSYISNTGGFSNFTDIEPNPALTLYALSQSGIAIEGVYTTLLNGNSEYVNHLNPESYEGTLFSKIGFEIEQLMPFFGSTQGEFNRSNFNKFLGFTTNSFLKQNNMVKPFTTNAYVSAAVNIGIVVNDNDNPMENLGVVVPGESVNTNASSDELIAINLPKKLDFPYLVLYSDIVNNPKYYGGPTGYSKLPALAYIARNYTTGDFFYSFATTWNFTADKDYVLTDITTEIRLPDGSPAPLGEASSVIYKITKPKIIPNLQTILNPKIIKEAEKENN